MSKIANYLYVFRYYYYNVYRDHNLPHIHAKYQDNTASIDLYGEMTDWILPRKQLRLVQAWVELHRDEILANWELAQSNQSLYKIDSLK